MGLYDNTSMWDDLKWELRYGGNLSRLITLMIVVSVFFWILNPVMSLVVPKPGAFASVLSWLTVPKDPLQVIYQPWSVFTHLFIYQYSASIGRNFIHLLSSCIWLYFFGRIFTVYLEDKRLVPTFLMGGLVGVLAFWLYGAFVPVGAIGTSMMGATAGVMAVVFSAVTIRPDHKMNLVFLGEIRIRWIALFALISSLFSISLQTGAGGPAVSLAGAITGFALVKLLSNGTDLSIRLNRIWDRIRGRSEKKRDLKVVHRRKKAPTPTIGKRRADDVFVESQKAKQERLDMILEKISAASIDALTDEERAFLNEMSKEV